VLKGGGQSLEGSGQSKEEPNFWGEDPAAPSDVPEGKKGREGKREEKKKGREEGEGEMERRRKKGGRGREDLNNQLISAHKTS